MQWIVFPMHIFNDSKRLNKGAEQWVSCIYLIKNKCVSYISLNSPINTIYLTHWGGEKMAAIFRTTFSNGFPWMKMSTFWLKFHWSFFLGLQLAIFQHWFRQWLGAVQATSHCLNQWWLIYWRIYVSLGLNQLTPLCCCQMYNNMRS